MVKSTADSGRFRVEQVPDSGSGGRADGTGALLHSVIAWNQKNKKERKRTMKRFLACLMVLLMTISLFPSGGWAEPVAEEAQVESSFDPTVATQSEPAAEPAAEPELTAEPTEEPAAEPTEEPAAEPTEEPAAEPTEEPAAEPTEEPAAEPTEEPAAEPTEEPAEEPTEEPAAEPIEEPAAEVAEEPTVEPELTEEPTVEPIEEPAEEGVPGTAEELAALFGCESVAELAEYLEVSEEELLAMSGEEIAAIYRQFAEAQGEIALMAVSDFTVSNGVLTEWTGSDVNLVIPSDLGITAIGSSVFKGKTGLQSVVIPSGVVSIGYQAFYNCKGLQSVSLPSTLTTIGQYAFYNCTGLQLFTVPSSVTKIDRYAFQSCTGLRTLTIQGQGLSSIGNYAFNGCTGLSSVLLPASVKSVGDAAFKGSGLKTLSMEGVTSIGFDAFQNTPLTSVTIPGTLATISYGAFYNCDSLKTVSLSSGVITVDQYAFYDCDALETVTLPSTVTSICNYAFYQCNALTTINFPGSLQAIGNYAFYQCTKLTKVQLPASVKSVGNAAFKGSGLKTLSMEGVTSIGFDAFQNTPLTSVTIPGTLATISYGAFNNCDSLKTVNVSSGVITVGEQAFYDCDALETVTLPSTVTSIYRYAFYSCNALTTINIPSSVTSIGDYAFYGCGSLKTITLPRSITTFGSNIFGNYSSLTVNVFADSAALDYCVSKGIPYKIVKEPAISSVSSAQTLTASGQAQATFKVTTSTATTLLKLCSESGSVVQTFTSNNASYSDSGDLRTWTLTYVFANDGARILYFIGCGNGAETAPYSYTVNLYGAQVKYAAFSPATVKRGTTAYATVNTSYGARYLHMYSEDGALVKTWGDADYSTASGNTRTWKISYVFSNSGNRTMTFKASRDGQNAKSGMTAKVTVEGDNTILSAVSSHSSITALNTLTFTVKTPTDMYYLKMYAENGALVRTWTASGYSKISGSTRVWTLPYAFGNAGDRTVTFKASKDGAAMNSGKSVHVEVLAVPAVTSAVSSHSSITALNTLTFTVQTPANGYVLGMFSEGGALVRTWHTDFSTLSGNVRIWKLSYAFQNAGDRKLTFKASADGKNYGTGKTVSVKVLAVPYVETASFSLTTVKAGQSVNIVAVTPLNAYNLHMFLENGKLYRTWHSADYATKYGDILLWRIPYTFSSKGSRSMTFKASADGVHYGTGKTAAIVVQ